MADTNHHETQICQLRAVPRGVSPLIWRRLMMGNDSTVYRDGGGMIRIDARGVRLDGLKLRRLKRFVHEYDFGG